MNKFFDIRWWKVLRNTRALPEPIQYLRIDGFYGNKNSAMFHAYDKDLNMIRTNRDFLGQQYEHNIHMSVILSVKELKKFVEDDIIIRLEGVVE